MPVPQPVIEHAAAADHELAAAAALGDRRALGELYTRFAPLVHGVILAHAGLRDADDLTQEVFVKAIGGIGGLRAGDSVGAWLASIARNEAAGLKRGVWRRALRLTEWRSRANQREVPPESGEQTRASMDALEVVEMIRALPAAYRESLILRLVVGLSGPQIAEQTGMTHGSVRVNLHRGMEMLRTRLRGRPGWEDVA